MTASAVYRRSGGVMTVTAHRPTTTADAAEVTARRLAANITDPAAAAELAELLDVAQAILTGTHGGLYLAAANAGRDLDVTLIGDLRMAPYQTSHTADRIRAGKLWDTFEPGVDCLTPAERTFLRHAA